VVKRKTSTRRNLTFRYIIAVCVLILESRRFVKFKDRYGIYKRDRFLSTCVFLNRGFIFSNDDSRHNRLAPLIYRKTPREVLFVLVKAKRGSFLSNRLARLREYYKKRQESLKQFFL